MHFDFPWNLYLWNYDETASEELTYREGQVEFWQYLSQA